MHFYVIIVGNIPFECEWEGDRLKVVQRYQGKTVSEAGIYNTILGQLCPKCGNPYLFDDKCFEHYLHEHFDSVDSTFQVGHYYKKSSMNYKKADDILNAHIWNLKKDPEYAKPLAQAMFLMINRKFPLLREADLIVSIPNHQDDNHRQAKAVALAEELGILYSSNGLTATVLHCLKKVKNIKLKTLNQQDREAAVQGMFLFDSNESVEGKKIILLDDVLTAGNVKGECATILKNQGADKVWIMVLGRTF